MTEIRNCSINKQSHIIFCSKCYYFPKNNQLSDVIIIYDVFGIQWLCPQCLTIVKQTSDQNFKTYTPAGDFYYDITQNKESKMIVVILMSFQMKNIFGELPMYPQMIHIDENNKLSMCKESPTLYSYQNALAAKQKQIKGRFFSWNTFIQRKQLQKIQYALWFCDRLKAQIQTELFICSESGQRSFTSIESSQKYDKKYFSSYLKLHKEDMFYNVQDPKLVDYLREQHYTIFLVSKPSQIRVISELERVKGECILLQSSANNFQKNNQQMLNKSISLQQKKCFFGDIQQITTEKNYIKQKINQLSKVKFNLSIFIKKLGQEWKVLYSQQNLKQSKETNKFQKQNENSQQIFANTKLQKNKNLQLSLSELLSTIQNRQVKITQIKQKCFQLSNKIGKNCQLKIMAKIHSHQDLQIYTIMYNYCQLDQKEKYSVPIIRDQIDILAYLEIYLNNQSQDFTEYFHNKIDQ